jgi:uncharacterized membrane protein YqaE (UPF0057 family)
VPLLPEAVAVLRRVVGGRPAGPVFVRPRFRAGPAALPGDRAARDPAAAKAFLVALIFMHLIKSPARTWLAAGVGPFWLGILLTLIMSDYFPRSHAAY